MLFFCTPKFKIPTNLSRYQTKLNPSKFLPFTIAVKTLHKFFTPSFLLIFLQWFLKLKALLTWLYLTLYMYTFLAYLNSDQKLLCAEYPSICFVMKLIFTIIIILSAPSICRVVLLVLSFWMNNLLRVNLKRQKQWIQRIQNRSRNAVIFAQ